MNGNQLRNAIHKAKTIYVLVRIVKGSETKGVKVSRKQATDLVGLVGAEEVTAWVEDEAARAKNEDFGALYIGDL